MRFNYWSAGISGRPPIWSSDWSSGKRIWKPSTLIRVEGWWHNVTQLQWINQVAEDNIDHVFLVFSKFVDVLESLIFNPNVMPILHVNNKADCVRSLDPYVQYCREHNLLPAVSATCFQNISFNKNIEWLILSGSDETIISNMINRHKHIPVYVESFDWRNKLPDTIDVRQLPRSLQNDLGPLFPNGDSQCLRRCSTMDALSTSTRSKILSST